MAGYEVRSQAQPSVASVQPSRDSCSPTCRHLTSMPPIKMLFTLENNYWLNILVENTDGFNYGYVSRFPGCRRKAAFSLASIKTRVDFLIIPIRNPFSSILYIF